MKLAALILLAASTLWGQVYSGLRTDVTAQPYPATIPNWGNLTGAGTCNTDPGFGQFLCRATDNSTPSIHGPGVSWIVDCGGSSETSFVDLNHDRMYLCEGGQAIHIFNPSANYAELYGSYVVPDCGHGGDANNLWFSKATNAIAYSDSLNASGNLASASTTSQAQRRGRPSPTAESHKSLISRRVRRRWLASPPTSILTMFRCRMTTKRSM